MSLVCCDWQQRSGMWPVGMVGDGEAMVPLLRKSIIASRHEDALSVLMARERARIGLAASEGDLSRRIVAYAYDDQEDSAADT